MTILPIFVTLTVDRNAQEIFQRWRDRYYPQARTPAHITLFRHLPGKDPDATRDTIMKICDDTDPFEILVTAPTSLANGVALRITSPELFTFRARIAEAFSGELKGSDRKPFEPHMTIQNRVTRRRAKRTLGVVRACFEPFTAQAEGVEFWAYQSGRWLPLGSHTFRQRAAQDLPVEA